MSNQYEPKDKRTRCPFRKAMRHLEQATLLLEQMALKEQEEKFPIEPYRELFGRFPQLVEQLQSGVQGIIIASHAANMTTIDVFGRLSQIEQDDHEGVKEEDYNEARSYAQRCIDALEPIKDTNIQLRLAHEQIGGRFLKSRGYRTHLLY
jgi:hypothetical protein